MIVYTSVYIYIYIYIYIEREGILELMVFSEMGQSMVNVHDIYVYIYIYMYTHSLWLCMLASWFSFTSRLFIFYIYLLYQCLWTTLLLRETFALQHSSRSCSQPLILVVFKLMFPRVLFSGGVFFSQTPVS